MKNELIRKATSEIEYPTLGTTEQILNFHQIETQNGEFKVERVDLESFDHVNVVYLSVEDEPFFFSLYFSKEKNELIHSGTENGNKIYLTATSEELTFEQLSEFTTLKGGVGWSIGDDRGRGSGKLGKFEFSRWSFEPIKSRAYEMDIKLNLLLTELEEDIAGVNKLSETVPTIISICHQQYISGNKGLHFDIKTINRLSRLNLGVDIDQYVSGNEI